MALKLDNDKIMVVRALSANIIRAGQDRDLAVSAFDNARTAMVQYLRWVAVGMDLDPDKYRFIGETCEFIEVEDDKPEDTGAKDAGAAS